jgi:hypothetical protein
MLSESRIADPQSFINPTTELDSVCYRLNLENESIYSRSYSAHKYQTEQASFPFSMTLVLTSKFNGHEPTKPKLRIKINPTPKLDTTSQVATTTRLDDNRCGPSRSVYCAVILFVTFLLIGAVVGGICVAVLRQIVRITVRQFRCMSNYILSRGQMLNE